MRLLSAGSFSAFIMQSAYYLHINQAVDHEGTTSLPNAVLSQEKHSVIFIHQCYDVVIDYNIFLQPLGSPSTNPAPGMLGGPFLFLQNPDWLLLFYPSVSFKIHYTFIYFVYLCVCTYGGQRTTCRSQSFPSTLWVLRLELSFLYSALSGLAASSFIQ